MDCDIFSNKAAKSRIKQGEQLFAHAGNNIEFSCETTQLHNAKPILQLHRADPLDQSLAAHQQTYWYFNGNLLNYAKTSPSDKNFSIEWDSYSQARKFRLFNAQISDTGNYTCKPTSAEPSTIRLHVKSSYCFLRFLSTFPLHFIIMI